MSLTAAQLQALKADIAADPAFNAVPHNSDGGFAVAAAYNQVAAPDWWVWRTAVGQMEIVSTTSVDGTTWSWPQFIARTAAEQAGWREMFADGGIVNPALPNVRQGFADIFSGTQQGPVAQRTHLQAVGRRKATRAEKLFSTGTGTAAVPTTMSFEGDLTYNDILNVWNS